jgi:hypothetical protein
MSKTLEMITLLCCAVYFGSTLYVTLVEHPARLACSTEVAWAQWLQSVKATPRYAASALAAAATALILGKGALLSPWTWGTILLLAVVPFSVLALLPIQRRLTEPGWSSATAQTRTELEQWGRRHAIRTCLGFAAFVSFLGAIVKAH